MYAANSALDDGPSSRKSTNGSGRSTSAKGNGVDAKLPRVWKHYLGIKYESGILSSRVAKIAPFSLASLLK